MKTITKLFVFFLFSFFFSLNTNAQVVSGMNYQAVIRNSSNAIVANATVGVKVSILQGSATGTVVFSESHTTTTNANGLATFVIGTGTPLLGTFFTIDWLSGLHFIKTETDPTGGTNYTITNTSQLNTVPYSQFAENSLYASFSGDSWKKTGNVVDLNTDFIGSTNNVDVAFKRNNIKAGKIGASNTAFGVNSLTSVTTGQNNTAIGSGTLQLNLGGFNNTAIGINALTVNTSSFNTAVGAASSLQNTTGASNTSLGHFSLKTNAIGNGNVAIGANSLENSLGFYNTAVGFSALGATTGDQNTALGWRSLENVTTGGGNIAIGKITTVPSPTTNNQLSIGNVIYGTNMGTTALGTIGIGVPVPTERLEVAGKTKTTNLQVTASAGLNKVLTSDAVGNATWQTSSSNVDTGFEATATVTQIIPNSTITKVNFGFEATDDANAYNPTTSEWTAPSSGFYHLDTSVFVSTIFSGIVFSTIFIRVNGANRKTYQNTINGGSNVSLSTNLVLNANDVVTIYFNQNSGGNATLLNSPNGSMFSAFKVY